MKNIVKISLLLIGLSFLTVGCFDDLEIPKAESLAMSGEWWTTNTVDGIDAFGTGYQLIRSFNTAANGVDTMWITDDAHHYWFKAKTPIDLAAKTFVGDSLPSSIVVDGFGLYEVDMTITNGQILDDAGTTRTGSVADSIYMELEFSDDPGTIYVVSGHRRSGFDADEF